jgi:hypothetical protein
VTTFASFLYRAQWSRIALSLLFFWSGSGGSFLRVSILFTLHLMGLVLLFQPVAGLLATAPVIEKDSGLHFFHLSSVEAYWQRDRDEWRYKSVLMAGYPSSTIQDLSIKLFEC